MLTSFSHKVHKILFCLPCTLLQLKSMLASWNSSYMTFLTQSSLELAYFQVIFHPCWRPQTLRCEILPAAAFNCVGRKTASITTSFPPTITRKHAHTRVIYWTLRVCYHLFNDSYMYVSSEHHECLGRDKKRRRRQADFVKRMDSCWNAHDVIQQQASIYLISP